MLPAAIYLRISRDREGRELGVDRQHADCQALAERLGFTTAGVYCDNDISASTRSAKPRPEYARLLRDAREGAARVVIAYTTGRLTRRPRENEDLIDLAEKHGVRFHFVASPSFDLNTSAGRMIARVMAARDAAEAEDISERVRRERDQRAAAGKWLGGGRPFGFEDDGVTVRSDEAELVRDGIDGIISGASLRGIAGDWNTRGVTTTRGNLWTPVQVRQVLVRARNAGLMTHRGEVVGPASWDAIVPEGRWRAAVSIIGDPQRRNQWNTTRRWLLSGIARCGVCGATLVVSGSNSRPRYRCRAANHVLREAPTLERFVTDVVLARLCRADARDLLVPRVGADDVADLRAQATDRQRRLTELATVFADGMITLAQLTAGTTKLREEIADIEARLARTVDRGVLDGIAGAPDVNEVWDRLDLDRRRAVVSELMTVTVVPARRGVPKGTPRGSRGWIDPAGVVIEWVTG